MGDPLGNPERLIRAVYAYVAYRIGPGVDADDVTSDVFERELRYRDSFDPNRGTPTAWLIGIARHRLNGERDPTAVSLDDAPELTAPTDLEGDVVRKLSLGDALSHLGDRDRELIALRYGADLSARDIAEVLSLTPNAVDVALHRAVERLRETLDRDELAR